MESMTNRLSAIAQLPFTIVSGVETLDVLEEIDVPNPFAGALRIVTEVTILLRQNVSKCPSSFRPRIVNPNDGPCRQKRGLRERLVRLLDDKCGIGLNGSPSPLSIVP